MTILHLQVQLPVELRLNPTCKGLSLVRRLVPHIACVLNSSVLASVAGASAPDSRRSSRRLREEGAVHALHTPECDASRDTDVPFRARATPIECIWH